MPKVKTYTTMFEGKPFTAVYNVSGKSGTFTCALPLAVADALDVEVVHADTLDACEKAFASTIKRYYEAVTSKKRVIVYEVRSTAYIWNEDQTQVLFNDHQIAFTKASAVSIGAKVFDECAIKAADGSVEYRYDEVRDCELYKRSVSMCSDFTKHMHKQKHEHQMDYTPEREQFFIKLSKGLETLVLQLDQLKDTDKALAFADSKLQLTQ